MIGVIFLTVLATGLWMAKQSGEAADLQMRRELVQQVVSLATAINPVNVRTLTFNAEDKNRPEFQVLCDQLGAYAEATGLRSIYTMALRNGLIVFGPESLSEGHPYASPPGTVYLTPSQRDFDIFHTARPQIQGPTRDEYGMFVTASAPVVDSVTGEVLLVVGVDVEADAWRAAVLRAQWFPGGITLVLLVILFLGGVVLRLRQRLSPVRAAEMRHTETILSVVFMMALSLAMGVYFHRQERDVQRNTFYAVAQAQAAVSVTGFHEMSLMLEQLGVFFESSQQVDRDEFSAYCRKIMQLGAMKNCLWIPEVPDGSAEHFIQEIQNTGVTNFTIWQQNADGLCKPVSFRSIYYPIVYVVPSGTECLIGFDENSEPVRAVALQQALRTGLTTATDLIELVSPVNLPAFLIFRPVDAVDSKGVVAFVVFPDKLLGGAYLGDSGNRDLEICLSQLRRGQDLTLMAGSSTHCGRQCWMENRSGLSLTVPIFRFGKAYALHLVPADGWLAAHSLRSGWQVGLIGLLVTLLVSSLVALITSRRISLEKLVDPRTAELKTSEERYDQLAEQNETIAWEVNAEGLFTYCSHVAEKVIGFCPDEIVGKKHFYDLHPEEGGETLRKEKFEIFARKEFLQGFENPVQAKDGRIVWVRTTGFPVLDANGSLLGYRGSDTNITSRKLAVDELSKTRAVLQAAMDCSPAGIAIADVPAGRLLYMNDAGLHICGSVWEDIADGLWVNEYTASGKLLSLNGTPLDPDGMPLTRAILYGETNSREFIIRRTEGDDCIVLANAAPILNAQGKAASAIVIFQDITARKLAEEKLRASEGKLDLALRSSAMGVWQWDLTEQRRIYDNQTCRLLGIDPVAYEGTAEEFFSAVHPDDRLIIKEALTLATEQDALYETEYRVVWPDGSIHHISTRGQLIYNNQGNPLKIIGICWDITERKLAEETLRQKLEELERFNRVTVAREMRMVVLKQEINALLKAAGQPEKYRIFNDPQDV